MVQKTIIPHSKPLLDESDVSSVSKVIHSGQIIQGKMVEKFERKMARYIGMHGAVATNSGTSALHLALIAMGIGRNDNVAIPSFVCSALLNVIKYVGAHPTLVDLNHETYNIDICDLKKK